MANRAYVDGEDGGFSCDGAVMAVVRVLHIDLPTYLPTYSSFLSTWRDDDSNFPL